MISFKQTGDFSKLTRFLKNSLKIKDYSFLDAYGRKGVTDLSAATPKDTGLTASSWTYEIVRKKDQTSIVWKNSNIQNGVPIAVILQYGHATKNGGWVQGRDYINPAIRPIFDEIAKTAWKEVKKL